MKNSLEELSPDTKIFCNGTTHYVCKEQLEKYGGKTKCCGCTKHDCKPPTDSSVEELFDIICSECGILEDKRKQELIRELGRREREKAIEDCIEALPKEIDISAGINVKDTDDLMAIGCNACLSEAQQAINKLRKL